jgi:hypothetical protein
LYDWHLLETIKQTFDRKYARWELILPAASMRERSAGSINRLTK